MIVISKIERVLERETDKDREKENVSERGGENHSVYTKMLH